MELKVGHVIVRALDINFFGGFRVDSRVLQDRIKLLYQFAKNSCVRVY